MINLCEIFYSIQGESTYAGLPCVFIRFAGCNLRCSYCDTKQSYETAFSLSPTEIVDKITRYDPARLVEITGGEPLLQEDLYLLVQLLNRNGYRILLETNGSLALNNIPHYVTKIVDVKCPGSLQADSFLPENLKYLCPRDELKFVLSDYDDYLFARKFISDNDLPDRPVLFSPVTSRLQPELLAEWILRDQLTVRLQLQLHKFIWQGNKQEGER